MPPAAPFAGYGGEALRRAEVSPACGRSSLAALSLFGIADFKTVLDSIDIDAEAGDACLAAQVIALNSDKRMANAFELLIIGINAPFDVRDVTLNLFQYFINYLVRYLSHTGNYKIYLLIIP
jgi:hypothetical protein